MFFKSSVVISSFVLATVLAACSSAEKRDEQMREKAIQSEESKKEAAIQAQKDAETKLFTQLKPEELRTLVQESVVYGYPLVVMDATREFTTNPSSPNPSRGGLNEFRHMQGFSDSSFKEVAQPNVDTLYSAAFVDLSKEPVVLSLPPTANRYYVMQVMDAWSNTIMALGTRTTGNAGGHYVILGPNWNGQVPANLRKIQSPTNRVMLVGRTYMKAPKDYEVVHALQNRYQLAPLSEFDRTLSTARTKSENQNAEADVITWKNTPNEMVVAMDGPTFFKKLSQLLVDNPPMPADRPMLDKLAKIGVAPGHTVDYANLPLEVRGHLDQAVKGGYERVKELAANPPGRVMNGWVYILRAGTYGSDYDDRAGMAWQGLGASLPVDTLVSSAKMDIDGLPLRGSQKYTLHFAKGQLPPVNSFWSLTMYDDMKELVPNTLKRHALGSKDRLKTNKDGSVHIYIQNKNPGKAKLANWLPAPRGNFQLMLRLYWPKQAALNGDWNAPGVQRAFPVQRRLTQRTAKRTMNKKLAKARG